MKESKYELNKSIIAAAWHPKRVLKLLDLDIEPDEM
jgi:hypothetical protein